MGDVESAKWMIGKGGGSNWRVRRYSDADDRMRFRLVQDGQPVVDVEGAAEGAMREMAHYHAVYSQDGPCYIEWYTKGRRWKATDLDEIESALSFRAAKETQKIRGAGA